MNAEETRVRQLILSLDEIISKAKLMRGAMASMLPKTDVSPSKPMTRSELDALIGKKSKRAPNSNKSQTRNLP